MANERLPDTPAPTDRPSFTVLVDGEELSRQYHVQSIDVHQAINRISSARLTLLDGDPAANTFAVSDAELFVPGREIVVEAGYHSQESPIFSGIVVRHGVKARQGRPSLLIIDCKHQAVRLTVTRRHRTFAAMTDSEVMADIAGNYDLDTAFADTAVSHPELVQYGATDWDFLVSRAEANGLMVLTNGERLATAEPDLTAGPVVSLLYGATMLGFDAELDARRQPALVTAVAWDCAGQQLATASADSQPEPEQGNIDAATLAAVLSDEGAALHHIGRLGTDELTSWAETVLLRARLAKIRGSVTFTGHAGVVPGAIIELAGVGERFNGKAFVAAVSHTIASGSWITEARFGLDPQWFVAEHEEVAEPPAGFLLPTVSGLQLGVVRQLADDPDGEERVQVTLPLAGDGSEGIWARVATLDAGNGRGSFFRPEIGDEVVLGFLNDDPRDPVILGMLNSSAKPAPLTADDDNHLKGFVTRSGIRLIFDDDKEEVLLATPAGKQLVISDDQGAIAIADENGNTVTLDSSGIAIDSPGDLILKAAGDLTLEGSNVAAKANAKFTAEGAAGAELTSSATAVLKGAIVQIN